MDWMAELFCDSEDSEKLAAPREFDHGAIRAAITSALRSAEASLMELEGKEYKPNPRKVELRGDGPSNRGSLSVGTINERKRRRRVAAGRQDVEALKKLQEKVKTPEGSRELSSLVRATLADAEKWFANGTANVKTESAGDYFEYLILDRLGVKSAYGAIMSNSVSKTLRAIAFRRPSAFAGQVEP